MADTSILEFQKWLFRFLNPRKQVNRGNYWEIFDPETHRHLARIRWENISFLNVRRWWSLPTEIRTVPDGSLVLSFCQPFRLWRTRLETRNDEGELIGYFQPKLISLNGGFWIYDSRDRLFAEVRSDWTQYEFQIISSEGHDLGRVSHKLVGLKRAFLYQECDYLVSASEQVRDQPDTKRLLLATVLAIVRGGWR